MKRGGGCMYRTECIRSAKGRAKVLERHVAMAVKGHDNRLMAQVQIRV